MLKQLPGTTYQINHNPIHMMGISLVIRLRRLQVLVIVFWLFELVADLLNSWLWMSSDASDRAFPQILALQTLQLTSTSLFYELGQGWVLPRAFHHLASMLCDLVAPEEHR